MTEASGHIKGPLHTTLVPVDDCLRRVSDNRTRGIPPAIKRIERCKLAALAHAAEQGVILWVCRELRLEHVDLGRASPFPLAVARLGARVVLACAGAR